MNVILIQFLEARVNLKANSVLQNTGDENSNINNRKLSMPTVANGKLTFNTYQMFDNLTEQ